MADGRGVAMMSLRARQMISAPQVLPARLGATLYASEAPGVLGETCKSQLSKTDGLQAMPNLKLMVNY